MEEVTKKSYLLVCPPLQYGGFLPFTPFHSVNQQVLLCLTDYITESSLKVADLKRMALSHCIYNTEMYISSYNSKKLLNGNYGHNNFNMLMDEKVVRV